MMNRKQPFEKRYLMIFVIVIIALLLVVVAVSLNTKRDLNFFEKTVKDGTLFIVDIVTSPIEFIKDKINDQKEKNKVYNQYKDLSNKKQQIDSIEASNQNLEDENKKLKDLLELDELLSDRFFLNATVTSRNIGYWYDTLTIDQGSKKGVEKDMAVMCNEGLIGTVTKVSNYHSTVKLLSTENMSDKISVKIKTDKKYIYGLISGYDSKTNTFTVEGISSSTTIKSDTKVVTTGMGNTFPSGLLVGTVTEITKDNFDLSQVVKVKSAVDFDDLEYVAVLKRTEE